MDFGAETQVQTMLGSSSSNRTPNQEIYYGYGMAGKTSSIETGQLPVPGTARPHKRVSETRHFRSPFFELSDNREGTYFTRRRGPLEP